MEIITDWKKIFEEIKYTFSGEITIASGGWPKFSGKHKTKAFTIAPSADNLTFHISLKSDFELGLTNENIFTMLLKGFHQDIQIGTEDFDNRYLIKGGPEEKVIAFLSYDRIRGTVRCFEPISSLHIWHSYLEITSKLDRNDLFTIDKMDFLLSRFLFLADSIESPEIIEEDNDEDY
jgi:hypothetical protein